MLSLGVNVMTWSEQIYWTLSFDQHSLDVHGKMTIVCICTIWMHYKSNNRPRKKDGWKANSTNVWVAAYYTSLRPFLEFLNFMIQPSDLYTYLKVNHLSAGAVIMQVLFRQQYGESSHFLCSGYHQGCQLSWHPYQVVASSMSACIPPYFPPWW